MLFKIYQNEELQNILEVENTENEEELLLRILKKLEVIFHINIPNIIKVDFGTNEIEVDVKQKILTYERNKNQKIKNEEILEKILKNVKRVKRNVKKEKE